MTSPRAYRLRYAEQNAQRLVEKAQDVPMARPLAKYAMDVVERIKTEPEDAYEQQPRLPYSEETS